MVGQTQRPVKSTWFIVVLTVMILACAGTSETGGSYDPDNTYATISKSKAVLNQYYEGTVTSYSTYIDTVEYHPNVKGDLPPGISWDSSYPPKFYGTPTQQGTYNVTIYFRDPNKGTYQYPNLADDKWYTHTFEIEVSRFEQPEYTTTISVTCTNNTTWTSTFYIDGVSVCTLGPGDSKVISVRSGKRVVQHTSSAGSLSPEEVWNLEAGKNYTWDLKPR